ncbi:hypothetical protein MTO96_001270 [Rhipicephalus appendiculatus]
MLRPIIEASRIRNRPETARPRGPRSERSKRRGGRASSGAKWRRPRIHSNPGRLECSATRMPTGRAGSTLQPVVGHGARALVCPGKLTFASLFAAPRPPESSMT